MEQKVRFAIVTITIRGKEVGWQRLCLIQGHTLLVRGCVSSHEKVRNHTVCHLNSGGVVTVKAGETSLDAEMRVKEGCGGVPGGPGKSSMRDKEVGGRTRLLCGTYTTLGQEARLACIVVRATPGRMSRVQCGVLRVGIGNLVADIWL